MVTLLELYRCMSQCTINTQLWHCSNVKSQQPMCSKSSNCFGNACKFDTSTQQGILPSNFTPFKHGKDVATFANRSFEKVEF